MAVEQSGDGHAETISRYPIGSSELPSRLIVFAGGVGLVFDESANYANECEMKELSLVTVKGRLHSLECSRRRVAQSLSLRIHFFKKEPLMFARNAATRAVALAVALLLTTAATHAQTPLGTSFTYQGELASGGSPATGSFDLRFSLFDAATGGSQIGSTLCSANLAVDAGRFATSLDFGPVFTGLSRFLQIEVRPATGLGCGDATGYTVLTPRQELTTTPNATFAQTAATAVTASNAASLNGQPASFYSDAGNLSGTLQSGRLSGTYTNALTLSNASNVFAGNGASITDLNATNISNGVLDAARMPTNWAAGGDLGGFFPSPTIASGAVTLNKLAPGMQSLLSKLNSLTPSPVSLDVITWGRNYYYNQQFIPAPPPRITYAAVSAGYAHGLALLSDGNVLG